MYRLYTTSKKLLADTSTPVSVYLRVRDAFPNSILLESSDYHSRENSMSYICCDPIAGIVLDNERFTASYPDGQKKELAAEGLNLVNEVKEFRSLFQSDASPSAKIISNGLFGYFTFECVQQFEDIEFLSPISVDRDIPQMQYHIYRYVIAIDHFKNELFIFEHRLSGDEPSQIDRLIYLTQNKDFPQYPFSIQGEESSNQTDEGFMEIVEKMKTHIFRGDVFQIVPSRGFSRSFGGDEFNVYRALRSINPSPYLFYFDYGSFKLFGSSPEAQLTISDKVATIHPIAGTFKRTGNTLLDAELARKLENDPKESAEHVMLVDLARNDLSRHCDHVEVKAFKEVQYYSHLIHLVSKVSGKLQEHTDSFNVVGDTFPAGTLSGAPKYKALQLIDRYEGTGRGFYSGAIGYLGFNGDFNHAIMIRSFMSRNNRLHYQAGAGIVADSDPQSELNEVNNKIAALRKAVEMAETIVPSR